MSFIKSARESSFSPGDRGRIFQQVGNPRAQFRGKLALYVGTWMFWAASVWNLLERHMPRPVIIRGSLNAGWLVLGGLYVLWVFSRLRLGRASEARLQGSISMLYACEAATVLFVFELFDKYGMRN